MYSLESPHWGDSNEYTQHTLSWLFHKITLNIFFLALSEEFSTDSKDEFESATENKISCELESLNFYCNYVLVQCILGKKRSGTVCSGSLYLMTSAKRSRGPGQKKKKKKRLASNLHFWTQLKRLRCLLKDKQLLPFAEKWNTYYGS